MTKAQCESLHSQLPRYLYVEPIHQHNTTLSKAAIHMIMLIGPEEGAGKVYVKPLWVIHKLNTSHEVAQIDVL